MSEDDGDASADRRAIEAVIARQFASLNWSDGGSADWSGFTADFFAGAQLYPAARPAQSRSVAEFRHRMDGVARTTLPSFKERPLGVEIRIFGNVAIAAAGCEMIENGSTISRGVEMLLLVKSDGRWQIVAQAWDSETPSRPLPAELAGQATPPSAAMRRGGGRRGRR